MARAADVGVEMLMTLGMPEALIGSAAGLPLLSWLADFSITLLNLITLV